ncbi:hypothetical protein [Bacillus sp. PS06]|uniref:hypothetical protein n=1 Tax=Bacillus sp. PS06 TaxID=2764176 RepID=UPI0017859A47|nr:hypothetical protein [Bacillus sp. PS06]MBD8069438.1 hypothetical protein [Bacillus sp. PS06]
MEILIMPKKFDENEIFVLIVISGLLLISILTKKLFPIHVFLPIIFINSFIGQLYDVFLAIPPFDIYDSFDTTKYDLFDAVLYLIVYPLYGYLFFYSFERFYRISAWIHVIAWAGASTFFEWVSLYFNVFQYDNWHISYSFPVYLSVFTTHVFFYRWLTKQLKHPSKRYQQNESSEKL